MQQFHSWAYTWKIPKPLIWKDNMHPHIHMCQDMGATQVPINRWMNEDVVYINTMEYYSAMKKWNFATCHNVQVVSQLFCNPMDCSLPGSSFHGISQATILEWVAISFFRGSSWPRDWTCASCISRWILYHWTTREALKREKFMHLFL